MGKTGMMLPCGKYSSHAPYLQGRIQYPVLYLLGIGADRIQTRLGVQIILSSLYVLYIQYHSTSVGRIQVSRNSMRTSQGVFGYYSTVRSPYGGLTCITLERTWLNLCSSLHPGSHGLLQYLAYRQKTWK